MDTQTSPVFGEHVRYFPCGIEESMDGNEFLIDEFPVGGFFDDDHMMPTRHGRRGQDIRSHLDELANRHPEFADSLRGPPWASEMGEAARGPRGGAGSCGEDDAASSSAASNVSDPQQEQEQADEPGPLRGRPRNNLPQYGLRNTVPDMGQRQQQEEDAEESRGKRSWSAPPDNRTPQRFVSRLDINPVQAPAQQAAQPSQASDNQPQQPQQQPQQQQPQQQQQQQKASGNVRHIPIFVEGRDEPVIPKSTSEQQHFQPQQTFTQQKRPFQNPPNNPPQQKQQNRSFNTSPKPFQQPNMQQQQQQQQQPQQNSNKFPPHPHQNQNAPPPEPQPKPATPPPKVVLDPISRVQAIQNEVAVLKEEVEKFAGNNRKDKEYIFLDEMLTRNLLKLDDIETEGKDDIRQARKSAVRSIQECINILEAKVGSQVDVSKPTDSAASETPSDLQLDAGSELSADASGETLPNDSQASMEMDNSANDKS